MKPIVAASLVVVYVAAVFFGAPAAGPGHAEWLLPVASILFVWAYLRLARRGPLLPVAVVTLLTLLLPLTVLAWIGLPSHHGWWASLQAVLQSLRENGALGGVELAISTLAAIGVAVVGSRQGFPRSNQDTPHAL